MQVHTSFISNTFVSDTRLNWQKIKTKAKQHPEAEILLFETYSFSLAMFII